MVHLNMFYKAIMNVDFKPIKVMHDIKPDEVNDDVKPDEANDDFKPSARSVVVEVVVRA